MRVWVTAQADRIGRYGAASDTLAIGRSSRSRGNGGSGMAASISAHWSTAVGCRSSGIGWGRTAQCTVLVVSFPAAGQKSGASLPPYYPAASWAGWPHVTYLCHVVSIPARRAKEKPGAMETRAGLAALGKLPAGVFVTRRRRGRSIARHLERSHSRDRPATTCPTC